MNTSPPSIDDIILRVKAEAKKQVTGDGAPQALPPLQPLLQYQPADVPSKDSSEPNAGEYYLEALLLEEGDAFICNAYQALLGRGVDPTGLAAYREVLAQRGKLSVLRSLQRSAEGQAHNAKLLGATLPFGWLRLTKFLERAQAKLGIGLGAGRLLHLLEQRYAHKLAVARLLQQRVAKVQAHLASIDPASQASLAMMLDLNESQLMVRRDLAMHRAGQHDQQRRIDRLLEELAQLGQQQPQAVASLAQSHLADKIDLYYRAFEDANRGSLAEIRAKVAIYLPRFDTLLQQGLTQPVLDIGCGRGEWLQLLQERGHAVRGVDMNPVMVAACREQGLQAEAGDAYAYLKALPDNSLAAITGFHIIEHLPFETLFGIVEEAYRVLAPGGIILFETPNPENVLVGSHTFYHDFSHRNPITPTSISFLAHYHHFEAIEIERSNPYPDAAKVPGDDPLTVRVNGHLCGPQDFALIARKPNFAAGGAA